MKLQVVHRTKYTYTEPATVSHHEARLTPRASEAQRTIASEIEVVPNPSGRRNRFDYFGNRTTYFSLAEPHRTFSVTATTTVETTATLLPQFDATPGWEAVVERLRTDRRRDVLQANHMRFASPFVPLDVSLVEYAKPSFVGNRPILVATCDLMLRINSDFAYDPTATDLSTPLMEVMALRRGVCQDFAHVMLGCMRSLGLAVRYTSGYLRTQPPPGRDRVIGADASHAWVSVWVPEVGWVDFDPTNRQCANDGYVTLAVGRDYSDVAPLRGVVLGGGSHTLDVSVDVQTIE